jgi:hypothetical protein
VYLSVNDIDISSLAQQLPDCLFARTGGSRSRQRSGGDLYRKGVAVSASGHSLQLHSGENRGICCKA